MNILDQINLLIQQPIFNVLFLVTVAWAVAVFLERFKIPIIIGELIAGIIIGPSVLNLINPSQGIELLSSLGMFFLIFYAGLENEVGQLKNTFKTSFWVGLIGTIVPFILVYSTVIYFSGNQLQAFLVGLALAGTSMVTKSRIMSDLDIEKSQISHKMMGASIFDYLLIFISIAVVSKIVIQGYFTPVDGIVIFLELFLFIAIAVFLGIAIFPKFSKYFFAKHGKGFTFAMLLGFIFAVFAEMLHLPMILGAYIAGLFVREKMMTPPLFQKMSDRFLAISHGFLGPIFIMSIAFKINFNALPGNIWFFVILVMAAFLGKYFGVIIGGLISSNSFAESKTMGIAMNSRGEIELVVATIGLQLGVLTNDHLSILVCVTFATTIISAFFLSRLVFKQDSSLNITK